MGYANFEGVMRISHNLEQLASEGHIFLISTPNHARKVVDVSTLDELQNEVVVTLCLFEKYFPPSFFDIMVHLMVHLTVHLVREVEVAIANEEPVSETLKWIAHGPSHYVFKYHGYVINSMFRIPIFKCDWVDNKNGIRVDDLGFTLVDFSKMAHKSNPFILASQAKEVFYGDDLMDNSIEHHLIISSLPQVESFNAMDDSDAICMRGMDLEQGEKPPTKRRCRGITRKSMIIKNRNRGVKLLIKYNPDVKNNLWDTIEASFTLDSKSMRNCMLTMGKCFRSFKNMLTVKYVIPFKDQSEDFREVQKERRNKHIYNHHLSRKRYVGVEDEMVDGATGYTEIIDRSILWKKTMEKKDGTYDEVVILVVEKIDKMLKESRESGRIFSGNNDIRTKALGTLEYSGRVWAKGKHYTPCQYFHSMADSAIREFVKESQE
ncbi:hypothetical protein CK203_059005 [Vitis vinifera]|uniref:DUF4218 domain-containing protein n=1 Tax=Vitis vinifera TaxID=29760 RepID=A0A438GEP6_VITVI|nr:hypothetical protein CK203_059005 [Vitis vinifera]